MWFFLPDLLFCSIAADSLPFSLSLPLSRFSSLSLSLSPHTHSDSAMPVQIFSLSLECAPIVMLGEENKIVLWKGKKGRRKKLPEKKEMDKRGRIRKGGIGWNEGRERGRMRVNPVPTLLSRFFFFLPSPLFLVRCLSILLPDFFYSSPFFRCCNYNNNKEPHPLVLLSFLSI